MKKIVFTLFLLLFFIYCKNDTGYNIDPIEQKHREVMAIDSALKETSAHYQKIIDSLGRSSLDEQLKTKGLRDSIEDVRLVSSNLLERIKNYRKNSKSPETVSVLTDIEVFLEKYASVLKISEDPKISEISGNNDPNSNDTNGYGSVSLDDYNKLKKEFEESKKDNERYKKDNERYKKDSEKQKQMLNVTQKKLDLIVIEQEKLINQLKVSITDGKNSMNSLLEIKEQYKNLEIQKNELQKGIEDIKKELNGIVPVKVNEPNFAVVLKERMIIVSKTPRPVKKRDILGFVLTFDVEENKKNNNNQTFTLYIAIRDKVGVWKDDQQSIEIDGEVIAYNRVCTVNGSKDNVRFNFAAPKNDGPYDIQIFSIESSEPLWESHKIETE